MTSKTPLLLAGLAVAGVGAVLYFKSKKTPGDGSSKEPGPIGGDEASRTPAPLTYFAYQPGMSRSGCMEAYDALGPADKAVVDEILASARKVPYGSDAGYRAGQFGILSAGVARLQGRPFAACMEQAAAAQWLTALYSLSSGAGQPSEAQVALWRQLRTMKLQPVPGAPASVPLLVSDPNVTIQNSALADIAFKGDKAHVLYARRIGEPAYDTFGTYKSSNDPISGTSRLWFATDDDIRKAGTSLSDYTVFLEPGTWQGVQVAAGAEYNPAA